MFISSRCHPLLHMKLPCALSDFRIEPKTRRRLADRPTSIKPLYSSKSDYRKLLASSSDEIADLQNVLYAHNRYALLLVFQGMDAAGKDGAIKHVMSGVNPAGCQVFSFKQPSSEELEHDFLWRTNKRLPERGRIGIFNRSYYEEVLIAQVIPAVLKNQRLPDECRERPNLWKERYADINQMEDYLYRNGTRVVKFYLHLSKEEQRKRFLSRIDEPDKNWKLTTADIEVRAQWDAFHQTYDRCLRSTSTAHAPWYAIPADDKKNARLLVAAAVIKVLRELKMAYPEATEKHREQLRAARAQLT